MEYIFKITSQNIDGTFHGVVYFKGVGFSVETAKRDALLKAKAFLNTQGMKPKAIALD
jgi:hypothetical protein